MVAIGEGAQESDLARHMIRNQEVELADQRGFHGSEIGHVEHDMAEARDRGVAGLEVALQLGIDLEFEMEAAARLVEAECCRSEARRIGKECANTCRSWESQKTRTKKKHIHREK